jgi:hypothetical protein
VLLGGPGRFDYLIGDSEGVAAAHRSGGDDLLDMGADGGIVIGDHNINAPDGGRATGAGDDRILGGYSEFEFLYGDSSVGDASVTAAGDDRSAGRGGDDTIFGDNINFGGDATAGRAGGEDKLDGDDGNDTLRAGPDDDRLNGGADTDDCDGEAGTGDRAKQCETPRWRALARPPDPAFVGPSRQGLPPARPSGYGEQPAATDRGPALIAGVDERVADA